MRKLAWAVIGLMLTAALVLVSGGWYFSNLIIDGMTITTEGREFDHRITAVDGQTLTYEVPDPADDYFTPNRAGMFLPDGYIQLAQDARVDGRTVTRGFELIEGEGPAVGDLGKVDWASWPDAESRGLVAKQVTYDSPLGPTPAVLTQPLGEPEPGRWAIVVHGIGGSVREGLRMADLLAERGYTALYINYRDDWQEQGAPAEDGRGNFGQTEWEDLSAAVGYATANGAEEILLVGYSMGGAIVASYLENAASTEPIIGAVLHSPAVNFSDIVVFGAEQMGLPVRLLTPLVWSAKKLTELRTGIRFGKIDYIDGAGNWSVPALVMACGQDDLVPPASIAEFAARLPDGQYYEFPDAMHTGEWNNDPARYEELVGGWLDRFNR